MVSSVTFGRAGDGTIIASCSACPWSESDKDTKASAVGAWLDHDCDESGRPGPIVGIDPSLRATGVVQVGELVAASTVTAKALRAGDRNVHSHSSRIERTAAAIAELVPPESLVAIEGPAIGARHGNPDERAGLRWSLIARLRHRGCLVVQVPPKSAKMWLTDNGNASKGAMLAAAQKYAQPPLEINSDHEADAFALAAMLGAWVGRPLTPIPPRAEDALKGVSWEPIEGKLP